MSLPNISALSLKPTLSATPSPPSTRTVVTPYRVSTITCNGSISTTVSLEHFFHHAPFLPATAAGTGERGILCIQFGQTRIRGTHPKRKVVAVASEERNAFDNQVTSVFNLPPLTEGEAYHPNVKLFRNGNVQMTGIRRPEDGQHVLELLADIIRDIARSCPPVDGEEWILPDADAMDKVLAREFRISMINSNFGVNYPVRRKALQRVLTGPPYSMSCSFEGPYPGVKLQYFWNSRNDPAKQGICRCHKPCEGKGRGSGEGQCKKVTVSVFESGNALITGANAFDQVDDAYRFIHHVFHAEAHHLRKVLPMG